VDLDFVGRREEVWGYGREFLRVFWKKKPMKDLVNENFMRKILECFTFYLSIINSCYNLTFC
jgi:hypothetical protein